MFSGRKTQQYYTQLNNTLHNKQQYTQLYNTLWLDKVFNTFAKKTNIQISTQLFFYTKLHKHLTKLYRILQKLYKPIHTNTQAIQNYRQLYTTTPQLFKTKIIYTNTTNIHKATTTQNNTKLHKTIHNYTQLY